MSMAYTIGMDFTFIKDSNKAVGDEVAALSIAEGLYANMTSLSSVTDLSYVVFLTEKNAEAFRLKYPKFNVIATVSGSMFYFKFLPWFVRKANIDVMFYPHTDINLNFRLRAKIVLTTHGLSGADEFNVLDKLTPFVLRRVNRIVAVSDFVKDELLKRSRLDPKKIVTIPNPLASMTSSIDVVFKKKHIVAVGSDKPQKNLILIIKAFEKLTPIIDHDLVLVGDISEKGEIYKYIKDNKLTNRIIVTGRVNREILFGYYKNADLFINTSTYEGFGLAPLEAMALKARVVSTPIPSISEIEGVRFDGDINYYDDETEVANKMLSVLKADADPDYLESRANRILNYYSLENVSRKYIQVFENV
jgi:glycosyltransferase involved in cell wall biosynthesis